VLVGSAVAVAAYHAVGFAAIGVVWPLVLPYLLAASVGRLRAAGAVAASLAVASVLWRTAVEGDGALQVVVGAVQDLGLAALAAAVGEAVWQRRRSARETARRVAAGKVAARARTARLLTAQRLEIAADLHDVAGHRLVLIGLQLRLAEAALERDPRACRRALAAATAAHAEAMADTAATVRLLQDVGDPRPRPPGPGLEQLPDLVAAAADAGVQLHLDVRVDAAGVPAAVTLVAFRICQEAVTNTLRHSAARRADLSVVAGARRLAIRYLDHGPARSGVDRAGASGGFGIAGMTARARTLGGTLRAGRCGAGHLVEAALPLHPGGPR
jgi:signal transduction histidine kinase